MPLKIVEVAPGQIAPALFCDGCSDRITNWRDGHYEWHAEELAEAGATDAVLVHRGCCRAYEEAHGGRSEWSWLPLDHFPVYLSVNLELPWGDDEAARRTNQPARSASR